VLLLSCALPWELARLHRPSANGRICSVRVAHRGGVGGGSHARGVDHLSHLGATLVTRTTDGRPGARRRGRRVGGSRVRRRGRGVGLGRRGLRVPATRRLEPNLTLVRQSPPGQLHVAQCETEPGWMQWVPAATQSLRGGRDGNPINVWTWRRFVGSEGRAKPVRTLSMP
jgi:hypothetical protein